MEQNRIHLTTTIDLDSRLSAMKAQRERLQTKIDNIQAQLQYQEDFLVFEKNYAIYNMKRKTLEKQQQALLILMIALLMLENRS